ncbi:hypothetical protein B0J17DRAFT_672081 [Rhizoctonia solani]|nr:hypothetical protein B0J17DRAFT_672081 [Rhizoctonia solani]
MAMLMTRSTPLGLGLLPNLNFTGACSTSRATELSGLVHVLIKAGSPSSNSNPETLCATFYLRSAWTPMNDDAPMLLEQCNSSLIPGETTGPGNFTATQLWQYDPKTHELRPILWSESGMSSESTPSSTSESNNPVASDMLGVDRENMTLQSSRSSVESARTIITQSSVAAQQMQGYTFSGATPTYSSKTATPSQAKVRRKSSHMEVGGHVAPPYTAVVIVEPYTLVFVPRTTAGPGTMLPDSPV